MAKSPKPLKVRDQQLLKHPELRFLNTVLLEVAEYATPEEKMALTTVGIFLKMADTRDAWCTLLTKVLNATAERWFAESGKLRHDDDGH